MICISILDNRELGLFLGAFEYLVKPIDRDRFMDELRRVEKRPDLIVLDLMMPEMDGFDVIGRLKESDVSRDIPIIVVTAKNLAQEEAEYLKANIERIVRKASFRREELLEDIRRALEKIEV